MIVLLISSFYLDIVAFLINAGANVHFRTPSNETLLFAGRPKLKLIAIVKNH